MEFGASLDRFLLDPCVQLWKVRLGPVLSYVSGLLAVNCRIIQAVSETPNGGNGNSRLDRIENLLEGHGRMLVDHDLAMAAHDAAMATHAEAMAAHDVAIRRIDEMLARSERRNAEAHERFEAEDKRLLTAQILMNGAMQKMAVAMEETTGKLDALINTVDGIIRPKGTL
jgi:hypothetical protein